MASASAFVQHDYAMIVLKEGDAVLVMLRGVRAEVQGG